MNTIKNILFKFLIFAIFTTIFYWIFELATIASIAMMKYIVNHHSTISSIVATIIGVLLGAAANLNTNKGGE